VTRRAGGHGLSATAGVSGSQETVTYGTHKVAACVVSYNPGPEVALSILSVLSQVSTVLVVDNASEPESKATLAGLCVELGVELIANEENVGLAGAYNQAARMVTLLHRRDWLSTLCAVSMGGEERLPQLRVR
jgi:glycosyltransferase involved in cell wall biosynthesis